MLLPIDDVEQHLRQWGAAITRHDHSLRWKSVAGESLLTVQAVNVSAIDGSRLSEIVRLTHTAPTDHAFSDAELASINTFTCMSALIRSRQDGAITLAAKISIFDGDDAAARALYAPLLATEAYMFGGHLGLILAGTAEKHPGYFGLSRFDERPPYDEDDFGDVAEFLQEKGIYVNAGGEGLTAEFPWDTGAVSAGLVGTAESPQVGGGRTSLYKIKTDIRHPYYGAGLLASLELPIGNREVSIGLCARLNEWEHDFPDLPPSIGAWCLGQYGGPAFVTFIPNELCFKNLPRFLAAWAGHRNLRAHYFLREQA